MARTSVLDVSRLLRSVMLSTLAACSVAYGELRVAGSGPRGPYELRIAPHLGSVCTVEMRRGPDAQWHAETLLFTGRQRGASWFGRSGSFSFLRVDSDAIIVGVAEPKGSLVFARAGCDQVRIETSMAGRWMHARLELDCRMPTGERVSGVLWADDCEWRMTPGVTGF